jgi:hypothetical protein
LPYGAGIDDGRLVSCLTVVLSRDAEGAVVPAIGTYEKGQAAAESLSFARYLLYQTVYWHHSSRALRTMVRAALEPLFGEGGKNAKKTAHDFETLLGVAGDPAPVGIREVLGFIEERTDPAGRELVSLLRGRQYYKRLLALHEGDGGECPLAAFRSAQARPGFSAALQQSLRTRFEGFLAGSHGPGVSLLAPERTDGVLARLARPRAVLCDAPAPSIGAREKLFFVPTPKMILKNYAIRGGVGRRVSDVWNQTHEQLMRIAARGHVFCHPEVRDVLLAAIGPEGVRQALAETMRRFG